MTAALWNKALHPRKRSLACDFTGLVKRSGALVFSIHRYKARSVCGVKAATLYGQFGHIRLSIRRMDLIINAVPYVERKLFGGCDVPAVH